jgi:RNA polymerase sigma factor (sigma-70 family)
MSDAREDRFCALYELTRPRIIAYVLRRTASPGDAADIISEVYEIAWRRADDVPEGHSGLLWLYVTARHVMANQRRRLHRHSATATQLAEELGRTGWRREATDAESLVMRSCLNSLSSDDRELLMLAGWEGLNASEIGRVLGCSPTAARVRLHRARTRLNVALDEGSSREKQLRDSRHGQDTDVESSDAPEEVLEQ